MTKLLQDYVKAMPNNKVVLLGYSFGASVLPFMLNLMPDAFQRKVDQLIAISPGQFADFEVTFATLLNKSQGDRNYPVMPECLKQKRVPISFIFGEQEDRATIVHFKEGGFPVYMLPGSHDYQRNYDALSSKILTLLSR